MKAVTVLGSTGSIGISTLDVISRHRDNYSIYALSANTQVDRMLSQCQKFLPEKVVMVDHDSADKLDKLLKNSEATSHIKVLSGAKALESIASSDKTDVVMAAIVGAAGLPSSLAAANAGKRILLANKESLVMSGDLFMQAVSDAGAVLLPVDSEHNAIFQSLPENYQSGHSSQGINKILLTASGGPFREFRYEQLIDVTPSQACAHPNWSMGQKISVDSASMMNKGLEVIEASWLFDVPASMIDVVIHPQSIIHSMVSYNDGSVIAQLGNPDMRTPIAYSLAWPERIESGVSQLDLISISQLNFEAPDKKRFPCLQLAYEAIEQGGNAVTTLNAANEIAVKAFLEEKIKFLDIPKVIEFCLEKMDNLELLNLDIVFESDQQARKLAKQFIIDNIKI
ncbi:MAG: 1-deoxy-D-xylulose-5-phosphate reductoisomerase [Gammaproteobacteria bacterium]|nr:1-deoxy-D-xylulose-5-phosphate reductoisomerase [Gammaproteobacteria bacterium]